jgi:hypothetical protein
MNLFPWQAPKVRASVLQNGCLSLSEPPSWRDCSLPHLAQRLRLRLRRRPLRRPCRSPLPPRPLLWQARTPLRELCALACSVENSLTSWSSQLVDGLRSTGARSSRRSSQATRPDRAGCATAAAAGLHAALGHVCPAAGLKTESTVPVLLFLALLAFLSLLFLSPVLLRSVVLPLPSAPPFPLRSCAHLDDLTISLTAAAV